MEEQRSLSFCMSVHLYLCQIVETIFCPLKRTMWHLRSRVVFFFRRELDFTLKNVPSCYFRVSSIFINKCRWFGPWSCYIRDWGCHHLFNLFEDFKITKTTFFITWHRQPFSTGINASLAAKQKYFWASNVSQEGH